MSSWHTWRHTCCTLQMQASNTYAFSQTFSGVLDCGVEPVVEYAENTARLVGYSLQVFGSPWRARASVSAWDATCSRYTKSFMQLDHSILGVV